MFKVAVKVPANHGFSVRTAKVALLSLAIAWKTAAPFQEGDESRGLQLDQRIFGPWITVAWSLYIYIAMLPSQNHLGTPQCFNPFLDTSLMQTHDLKN